MEPVSVIFMFANYFFHWLEKLTRMSIRPSELGKGPPKAQIIEKTKYFSYASKALLCLSSSSGYSVLIMPSSRKQMVCTMLMSITDTTVRIERFQNSNTTGTYLSNRLSKIAPSRFSREAIHLSLNGPQPRSVSLMKITPARETVAGEALRR